MHGVRSDTDNRQILSNYVSKTVDHNIYSPLADVLQKRPTTPTLKHYTIAYLKDKTKSFDYTLSVLSSMEQQIYGEITRLGGNKGLEDIMRALHVDG